MCVGSSPTEIRQVIKGVFGNRGIHFIVDGLLVKPINSSSGSATRLTLVFNCRCSSVDK